MAKGNLTIRENIAPLWLHRQEENGNFGEEQTEFSESEVQKKVLSVLQMCEDLFLLELPVTESHNKITDLLDLETVFSDGDIPSKPSEQSFRSSLVDQWGNHLSYEAPQQKSKPKQNLKDYREKLKKQISLALESSQVWESLQPHLKSELTLFKKYKSTLAKLESAQKEIDRREVLAGKLYYEAKKKQRRLTEKQKQLLKSSKQKSTELKAYIETTINTNDDETLDGFMAFQNLRDYKVQAESTGFVKTPSVKALISKTRNALIAGKKVFLLSPTGTGKTALAGEVLSTLKGGVQVVACHEGMTPRDFHGYQEMKDGNTFWSAGAYEKAKTEGDGLLVDEVSIAPNKVLLELKSNMFKDQDLAVIFTGNPKDEHTQDRERMDPALLREMSGIKMDYIPATESRDIILAGLSKSWGIPMSQEEVELITKLCEAASEMQQLHMLNGDADAKKTLGYDEDDLIRNKFLDPGTLFSLFLEWEKDQAEGKEFSVYLGEQLQSFIKDNGTLRMSEENKLLQKILFNYEVITNDTGNIESPPIDSKQDYILPSEMGFLMPEKDINSPFTEEMFTIQPKTHSHQTLNSKKGQSKLESGLEQITNNYLSSEKLMDCLESCKGVTIKISKVDKNKALNTQAKILKNPDKINQILEKADLFTQKSEDQAGALVHGPYPEKIKIDFNNGNGFQFHPFNPETLSLIIEEEFKSGFLKKPMRIQKDVIHYIRTKQFEQAINIWTGACLTGSKNRMYDKKKKSGRIGQLAYQKKILGKDTLVSEQIYMAIMLHYLLTGKQLLKDSYMRLNVKITGGILAVSETEKKDDKFILVNNNSYSFIGIGGQYSVTS